MVTIVIIVIWSKDLPNPKPRPEIELYCRLWLISACAYKSKW